MENEELLPKPELDLPKPQTDLPLPEKELPSHSASAFQGESLEPRNNRDKPKLSIFRNKIFILFVLFSFLIAFLIGGFVLGKNSANKQVSQTPTQTLSPSTTPDQTADWKTYTNNKYQFSLKYPASWSFEESERRIFGKEKSVTTITFGPLSTTNHVGETVSPYVSQYIILNIYDSPPNTDLEKFNEISSDARPVWKDITVGGLKGKEVKHIGCQSGECREILFQQNRNIFNFFEQNSLKELDQILSTFKFTDSLPTPTLKKDEKIFCTQEAKQCPDGTWVGRTGPKCEFTPCPGE